MNPEELDPEIAADYEEVKKLGRLHGMVPYEERVENILSRLSPEEALRFRQNEEALAPFEERLTSTEPVERLSGLQQLGGKMVGSAMHPNGSEISRFAFHTRHDHSEIIALYAKVVGARLSRPLEDIKMSVGAAWLHDVGHSAFCHTGDELLKERGMSTHEERGLSILNSDRELVLLLSEEERRKIGEIIEEENASGQLQSVIDTIAYLDHDARMFQMEPKIDAIGLLRDIEGFDEENKALKVKTPALWQNLLDVRAEMMRDIYYTKGNKVVDEALRELMRVAVDEKHIDLQDIAETEDMMLRIKLQTLVQIDPSVRYEPEEEVDIPLLRYKDLYTLAGGSIPEGWHEAKKGTKEEAEALLCSVKEKGSIGFIVSPYDYTKKTLRIVTEGEIKTLKSTLKLPEDAKKYFVYFSDDFKDAEE